MIDKKVIYNDKDFSKHLKGLDLSEEDIKYILGETTRKKFEGGGDGGGDGGDGGGGDGGGDGGDGGDSGSDGSDGGEGDSGPGGSDDGSGHGGPGPGAAGDDSGSMGGIGMGDVGGLGVSDTSGMSVGDVAGTSENAGLGGVAGSAVGAAATDAAAAANTGVMGTISNLARQAFNAYAAISPTAIAVNAISNAISNAQRGVTAPNDFSQATESVQSGPSTSPSGGDGGITNIIPERYQLYYETNPQNLDEFTRRIRLNLGLPI